jgi:glutamate synthase (NADPH) small chain
VEQRFAISTVQFEGDSDGNVTTLRAHEVEMVTVDGRPSFQPIEGSQVEIEADLVLLAMGFVGPEKSGLLEDLGVELDARGNVARNPRWQTNADGVYVCGDMGRGQSLIVWAIAEGRACAAAVDADLMGDSLLPSPVTPDTAPIR